jgi:hypothetical protein
VGSLAFTEAAPAWQKEPSTLGAKLSCGWTVSNPFSVGLRTASTNMSCQILVELHLHFPFIYNQATTTRLQCFVRFFSVQVDAKYKQWMWARVVAWTNAKNRKGGHVIFSS